MPDAKRYTSPNETYRAGDKIAYDGQEHKIIAIVLTTRSNNTGEVVLEIADKEGNKHELVTPFKVDVKAIANA